MFEPGTKCVVVWQEPAKDRHGRLHSDWTVKLLDIIVMKDEVIPHEGMKWGLAGNKNVGPWQAYEHEKDVAYPIAWLRKYDEDMDEDDRRLYKEVPKDTEKSRIRSGVI